MKKINFFIVAFVNIPQRIYERNPRFAAKVLCFQESFRFLFVLLPPLSIRNDHCAFSIPVRFLFVNAIRSFLPSIWPHKPNRPFMPVFEQNSPLSFRFNGHKRPPLLPKSKGTQTRDPKRSYSLATKDIRHSFVSVLFVCKRNILHDHFSRLLSTFRTNFRLESLAFGSGNQVGERAEMEGSNQSVSITRESWEQGNVSV